MRREDRVTVQGPVKNQQPDGMSHGGGRGVVLSGLQLKPVKTYRPLECHQRPMLRMRTNPQFTGAGSSFGNEGWQGQACPSSCGSGAASRLYRRQLRIGSGMHRNSVMCPPPHASTRPALCRKRFDGSPYPGMY